MTPPTTPSRNSTSFDRNARRSESEMPMDPYAGMDPKMRQAVMQADKSLAAGRSAQGKGVVTGPPVQNSVAPSAPTAPALASRSITPKAPTTAAPNQPWWHSLADHIMSWFAPPAVKSVSKGAAYLADGGKSRTAGINKVIDEASK